MALISFFRRLHWLYKRARHFRKGRPLLEKYRREIEACYGETGLSFRPSLGGFGTSFVYFIFQKDVCRGVLRILPTLTKTVDFEWKIYQKGGPLGLTPKGVWKSNDGRAIVNESLSGKRCIDYVNAGELDMWEAVRLVWKRIAVFHAAIGCSLGDASLLNTFIDPEFRNLIFVDFEMTCGNRPEDYLFDYAHVLEVLYKYMNEAEKDRAESWLPKQIAAIPETEKEKGCACHIHRLRRVLADNRFRVLREQCEIVAESGVISDVRK